jgi:hypothetical protein
MQLMGMNASLIKNSEILILNNKLNLLLCGKYHFFMLPSLTVDLLPITIFIKRICSFGVRDQNEKYIQKRD